MRSIIIIIALTALSGCSGRMVCEWQTQDERFEEIIRSTIEEFHNAKTEAKPTTQSENLQGRESDSSEKHAYPSSTRRDQAVAGEPAAWDRGRPQPPEPFQCHA